MKYIGNIITTNKIDVSEFFNISNSIKKVDTTLPTLIIGWKQTKEMFPQQDILEHKITDTVSWTFSKREKRYKYEEDLSKFIDRVIKSLDDKINYKFFNFIISSKEKQDKFIKYINNGNCSIYHNYNFLYAYNPINEITIGISLQDLRYVNIEVKTFIKMLNKYDNNIVMSTIDFTSNTSLSLINENIKIIAYLNYLKFSNIYKEKDYDKDN